MNLEKSNRDSPQGRDRATSGRDTKNFNQANLILIHIMTKVIPSNLNSKLFRFHCVRPNVGLRSYWRSLNTRVFFFKIVPSSSKWIFTNFTGWNWLCILMLILIFVLSIIYFLLLPPNLTLWRHYETFWRGSHTINKPSLRLIFYWGEIEKSQKIYGHSGLKTIKVK